MLRIDIKTYNYLLLQKFIKKLDTKLKFSFTLLPSKRKNFVVKKSPHVFGRSKEKYYLKTYLGIITLKYLRKNDLFIFFLLLKSFKYKEGLGLKFTFI